MKRITYLLLVVVLAQFLGLKGLCAPAAPASHDCCPPGREKPAENPSPLPDCCVATAARDQGGVAQTRAEQGSAGTVTMVEDSVLPGLAPPPANPRGGLAAISHPVSPPLTPLLQTCVLLI